jgi:hypothetical protein
MLVEGPLQIARHGSWLAADGPAAEHDGPRNVELSEVSIRGRLLDHGIRRRL